jgi:hypothetical protein
MLRNKTIYRSADGGAGGGGNSNPSTPNDSVPPAEDANKQPNQQTPEPEIKDPLAFYKAQAEKNDRLREKAQAEANEAKRLAETLQNDVVKGLTAKYEALLAEFEAMRQQAIQATTEALRARIAGEFKLGGEAVGFLTASDEDGLRKQAEQLAKLAGVKNAPPPTGNVGNPAGNGGLTLEDYKKMTPQEVKARLEEAKKLLAKG